MRDFVTALETWTVFLMSRISVFFNELGCLIVCPIAEEFLLEDAKKYNFLTAGKVVVPAMDDSAEFQSTVNAMQIMGMSEDDISCEYCTQLH